MSNDANNKNRVLSSLIWAFLERWGTQGAGLIISIILARLLQPEDHGVLAIMMIFVNLAIQFVQSGFSTSLIQNRNVTDEDYSSVLHVSLILTLPLYGLIFFCAPLIGNFYEVPGLTQPLRVLALVLFPSAFQSVQIAKLKREMDFKRLFYLTLAACLIGGIAGVIVAFCGGGVWALVTQQLGVSIGTCLVLWIRLKWRPRAVINWNRVRILFSFGWKLLAAGVLNSLYEDLAGLIIGKKYTATTLAYYNKGQLFPQTLLTNFNGALTNVMLPVFSRKQDDMGSFKAMMRRTIQVTCFVFFPMAAGLAAVARSVVVILLTEKWLPCVPFLQLTCVIYAFNSIFGVNLQTINALGRSDIFLKLEIIKKIVGISVLGVTVFYFHSAIAIVWGNVALIPFGMLVNFAPNKKLAGYSLKELLRDIIPTLLLASIMCVAVLEIGTLFSSVWAALIIQIITGIAIYIGGAALFRMEAFQYVLDMIKPYIRKLPFIFHRSK